MLVHPQVRGGIAVYTARLTAADIGLRQVLDGRERRRVESTVGEANRARILIGAALLRTVAGSLLGVPAAAVTVDRTCSDCGRWHGRPTLPGTELDVSVSHSGGVVVVAVLAGGRVGVDVERVDGRPVSEVVAWTIAEARFKAGDGPGLMIHHLPPPAPAHVLTVATDQPDARIEVIDGAAALQIGRGMLPE